MGWVTKLKRRTRKTLRQDRLLVVGDCRVVTFKGKSSLSLAREGHLYNLKKLISLTNDVSLPAPKGGGSLRLSPRCSACLPLLAAHMTLDRVLASLTLSLSFVFCGSPRPGRHASSSFRALSLSLRVRRSTASFCF